MSNLKYWLEGYSPEIFTFRWCGRAIELFTDYAATIPLLLDAIENASLDERREFYREIYETLYFMAGNNDVDSINKLFTLCPDLKRKNYFEGVSPLGEAIEHNALEAMAALIGNGMDPDDCSFGFGEYSVEFALSCKAQDETILWLVEQGANVQASDIISVFVYNQRRDLAAEMLSKSSNIHFGMGIPGMISCIEDELAHYRNAFNEKEKSGYAELLAFLKSYRGVKHDHSERDEETP